MTSRDRITVAADELRALTAACFEHLGIGREDAAAVGDALVYANLRGIDSHGFERVPVYMRRVRAGLAAGSERMSVLVEHGALRCLDGGHGLGPAVGVRACGHAAELARRYGIGLVAVRNATNFGAAGFYAVTLSRQGLVGFVTTNAPKMMAPHGAAEPFLGSNPIAIAIPLGGSDDFVLDFSTTVAARGKIRRAQALGDRIDPNLALDAAGRPTRDPAEALAGTLLPAAGAKGSGLALAIALLTGLLGGAEFDDEVASIYADGDRPQNLGQLFGAVDPSAIADRATWAARADALVERLHALRVQPGGDAVRYPGEGAASRARRRSADGIPVDVSDLDRVAGECRECGADTLADSIEALKHTTTPTQMGAHQ